MKGGRHLLDLINEVLDIARIEAGHLSLSLKPIPISLMMREALDIVQPLAAARQIQIIDETCEEDDERYVLADRRRLKQVLLNFLSNAVKYNGEGGRVIVSFETMSDEPVVYAGIECVGQVHVLMLDTGPGLTASDMARLFVPFERLGANGTEIEGTGIGLSLCKLLVEAMNGQVGVESDAGHGSTFWLELPRVNAGFSAPAVPESFPAGTLNRSGFDNPRTILYIEDNLANINLVEHVLSDLDSRIKLLPAMQGHLGLDMAARHQPDLILLDVNLPDIMGDVVLSRLKAIPETRDIPVIILSADATPVRVAHLLTQGARQYLTKPIEVKQFLQAIRDAIPAA